ncbi:hypothetical protein PCASD_24306 [Puccinia coronata f. sp. avenae]|uniref:Uncharacterized protein n=1 Tax=Puccinia coronata f. sp. avenae TaxID=200324 RepID=A0A2N5S9C4_9BASI|nr:hypothetical protein PCASD_24306 [Puccinia coronata f. sp. avenae]
MNSVKHLNCLVDPGTSGKHPQTQLHLRCLNETLITSSFIPTLLPLVPLVCGYLKPSLPLLVVGLDKKNIISFISAIIQLPSAWLPCTNLKYQEKDLKFQGLQPSLLVFSALGQQLHFQQP